MLKEEVFSTICLFPSWLFWCCPPFSPLLLFFFICLLPNLQSFHSFSLFLLTVKQEKDVLYRLGSTGPQLPNNTLIYQPPPASLHEEAVLQCWLLLTARKAVCISGYTSLGCVWGNEMALLVMYLPSPFAEARLWIHLVISPFYQDTFTDKRNDRVTADPGLWLFYIFSPPPSLDNTGWVLSPSVSLFLSLSLSDCEFLHDRFCSFFPFSRLLLSFCSDTMSNSRWRLDICRSKKQNKWI